MLKYWTKDEGKAIINALGECNDSKKDLKAMANNTTQTYREFRKSAQARLQAANMVLNKQASFEATDPTCQGTVAIPDCGDGSNRAKLNLPENMTNYGVPDKLHNLCSVTRPNGTGQGEYRIPRNGTARDAAVNSFTAPMDKLADAANSLRATAAAVRNQAQARPDVQMSNADVNDAILAKLASLGAMALEHEEGRRTMQAILEKEAGIREAQNIIYNTQNMMNKYANAQQQQAAAYAAMQQEYARRVYAQQAAMQKQASAEQYAMMQKVAAASLSHQAILDQFETDLEKKAYAQGALDGEQAAQALEAGVSPAAADVPGGVSDADIINTLQELVASGQLDEQDLQMLLGGVQQAGADGDVTDEEIAQLISQAVQSGEITPDQASAIATAVLQAGGGIPGGAPAPEAAPAGPPVDPGVAKTASFHLQNTANILNKVAAMA